MDVEHLWKYSETDFTRQTDSGDGAGASGNSRSNSTSIAANPLLASAGLANGDDSNPDLIANLCSVADHRLYKIVKWCKSLPLFKNISVIFLFPHFLKCDSDTFRLICRLTIKYVCSSIPGVNYFYFRAVFDPFQRLVKFEFH